MYSLLRGKDADGAQLASDGSSDVRVVVRLGGLPLGGSGATLIWSNLRTVGVSDG
jgi:hypothetical protein